MGPTRRGLEGAAGYLGTLIGAAGFVAAWVAGVGVFRAILFGGLCALPCVVLEQAFGLPELWRWARANWRPLLVLEAVAVGLVCGLKSYTRVTGMTRVERIHLTLAFSLALPFLALIGIAFAYHCGFFRSAKHES